MEVTHSTAEAFVPTLTDGSVELLLTDPPYSGITDDKWDNQWSSPAAYAKWLTGLFYAMLPKLTLTGSIVFFGGIGKHGNRPLLFTLAMLEQDDRYTFRNWITWQKRRAYGKSHDYLFCREEVLWYSKRPERTGVTFNVPLLSEKRGYAGFNEKYPAKSEFKRVSNVWTDIPELMRPTRSCEKPVPLMRRFVETHTNPGDLVVDLFVGTGPTRVACLETGRQFAGCDADENAVRMANSRTCPNP